MPNNKKLFCHIIGGYGRDPINRALLSPESLARSETDGPCLTIAVVPTRDEETGMIQEEIVKIFAPPVKHPRETVPFNINLIYPSNPAHGKKPGT